MILVIDNYDSFTFNITQLLATLTDAPIVVKRNDEISVAEIETFNPTHIVLSPGPGAPRDSGICADVVRHFMGKKPILGVCLGHQVIAETLGATVDRAKAICHGDAQDILLDGRGLFRNIGKRARFTRYHSLAVLEKTIPDCLEVTARAQDGEVMGIRHKIFDLEGVQFHPESVESEKGKALLAAFLNYRRDNLPHAKILENLFKNKDLDEQTAFDLMTNLTDGTMDERVMASLLTAMAAKGVAISELVGSARAILKRQTPFVVPESLKENLCEIVGTGGDAKGSFNISSLSAIVAASAGVQVAKHGNRAVSSKSGAADFFESLGISIFANPNQTAQLLEKTGFCFLMAPVYHAAMRFAAPVRAALGIKTIMNLLGPLLNPAGATIALLGVYDKNLLEIYARAAFELGLKRVLTVASEDGFDEISPFALTHAFYLDNEKAQMLTIFPEKLGVKNVKESELLGGDAAQNAIAAKKVLENQGNHTIFEAVALNAGALLWLAQQAKTLEGGIELARQTIQSGTASAKLQEIIQFSTVN